VPLEVQQSQVGRPPAEALDRDAGHPGGELGDQLGRLAPVRRPEPGQQHRPVTAQPRQQDGAVLGGVGGQGALRSGEDGVRNGVDHAQSLPLSTTCLRTPS
jgi:hypothetical protein